MTVPVWITPISMVVYTVLLMPLTEFMRRHYRTSMWVWVVSLVTIPLWIINIPRRRLVPVGENPPSSCRSSSQVWAASPP